MNYRVEIRQVSAAQGTGIELVARKLAKNSKNIDQQAKLTLPADSLAKRWIIPRKSRPLARAAHLLKVVVPPYASPSDCGRQLPTADLVPAPNIRFRPARRVKVTVPAMDYHREPGKHDTRNARPCAFCMRADLDFQKRKPIDQVVSTGIGDTAASHLTEEGFIRHRMAELRNLASRMGHPIAEQPSAAA